MIVELEQTINGFLYGYIHMDTDDFSVEEFRSMSIEQQIDLIYEYGHFQPLDDSTDGKIIIK